ncbi:MAG: hypothetical protein JXB88_05685 [Spirochaetales bacterium]|nr:hypothetical protein [Spirochaetales bacterium]
MRFLKLNHSAGSTRDTNQEKQEIPYRLQLHYLHEGSIFVSKIFTADLYYKPYYIKIPMLSLSSTGQYLNYFLIPCFNASFSIAELKIIASAVTNKTLDMYF